MKVVWRFATMENGEQFVMIAGMMSMLKLYVGSWGSLILVSRSSNSIGSLLNSYDLERV